MASRILERDLDRVHDEPVALELHLTPRHLEARDQLLVGARRGVREHRFAELRLDGVEIDVLDQQHRALADRRHRLVRRVGLIDPQPHLARVRDEPCVHERLVGRAVAKLALLCLIGLDRGRIAQPGRDIGRRPHGGAGPQEGREAGKARPRLVPEEDQVGLDREAFLHDAAHVVHVPVEGAVGEIEELHPVEAAFGAQRQERALDGRERHGAIHRVFRHRERLDVDGLHARQHHAVMVRLVAVAVDKRDVAGRQEGLDHHLVGGRGAVGDEEDVIGPEGAGRHLLRALDVAGRLEKAVEAAGRGAALGEEQVDAVELAHVADPVGFEDRLATRDRKRMEGADRPPRIALQVVEERRLVAVAHAFENRQVKLERLLDGVEDPAHAIGRGIAGEILDVTLGQEEDVELRADALQGSGEAQRRGVAILRHAERVQHRPQHGRLEARAEREAFRHHDRGERRVDGRGAKGVLERSDEDRLVDELVLRAAEPAHLVGERRPACGRLGRNEQDLAVGPAAFRPLQARRHDVGHLVDTHLGVGIPFRGALPIGAGHEPVRNPPRQTRRAAGVVRRDPLAQQGEEFRPGIGVIALDSLHRGNGGIEVGALRCPGLPLLGQARDLAPVVEPRRMHEQELIDAGGRPEQVRGGARLRFGLTLLGAATAWVPVAL